MAGGTFRRKKGLLGRGLEIGKRGGGGRPSVLFRGKILWTWLDLRLKKEYLGHGEGRVDAQGYGRKTFLLPLAGQKGRGGGGAEPGEKKKCFLGRGKGASAPAWFMTGPKKFTLQKTFAGGGCGHESKFCFIGLGLKGFPCGRFGGRFGFAAMGQGGRWPKKQVRILKYYVRRLLRGTKNYFFSACPVSRGTGANSWEKT